MCENEFLFKLVRACPNTVWLDNKESRNGIPTWMIIKARVSTLILHAQYWSVLRTQNSSELHVMAQFRILHAVAVTGKTQLNIHTQIHFI